MTFFEMPKFDRSKFFVRHSNYSFIIQLLKTQLLKTI
jgi:hypothetical protein